MGQINRGLGLAAQNTNILKKNIQEFRAITGQKPIITRAKKSIAGFKVREEMELGLSVRSFDKAGNYTFGLKEQLVFPEVDYDDVDQVQGLNVTIVLHSSLPKKNIFFKLLNGLILFKFLRFPLNDHGYYEKYSSSSEISQLWDRKKHLRKRRKRWSQE